MQLTPEERAVGKENFYRVVGDKLTRRDFLEGSLAAGVVSGAGLGSFYFSYGTSVGDPVRVGVIGTGDEGNVLIGAHTPDYVQIKAIADIRPYNIHRTFHGDQASASALAARPGLMSKYGWSSRDEADKHITVYDKENGTGKGKGKDYHDLLNDPDIEAVIIALPLFLHAPVAIEAMQAGKHVLTEKLMAHSVHECKDMGRVAAQTGMLLATGHQRHYSILYDNAVDTIRRGLIGRIHYIRAQWHRGNLPGKDSWSVKLPDQLKKELNQFIAKLEREKSGTRFDALTKRKELLELQLLDAGVDAAAYGYEERTLSDGRRRSPLEELLRWRLWDRTGGGLMAELGSHQLDAAGIFISSMDPEGKKVHPLNVSGVGGRYLFPPDRDCDDHVFCSFEYPMPEYVADGTEEERNKKAAVTYSSINGNGFGGYGETVLGTKGTLMLEREKEALLFKTSATSTKVKVSQGPALDSYETGGGSSSANVGERALSGPISRGYTEEIEHWAWCIRNPDPENVPRCHPKVALADAVIALTTNMAIAQRKQIEFKPEWFEIDNDETPEGVAPSVKV